MCLSKHWCYCGCRLGCGCCRMVLSIFLGLNNNDNCNNCPNHKEQITQPLLIIPPHLSFQSLSYTEHTSSSSTCDNSSATVSKKRRGEG